MKPLVFALCLTFASSPLTAQKSVWQPSRGHTQIPIWPGAAPDPQPVAGPEVAITTGKDDLVGGRPWISVESVSQPTMTVYSPTGKNTGAAVVVFPGGGYEILASKFSVVRARTFSVRELAAHGCRMAWQLQ